MMNTLTKTLFGALAVALASTCFAAQPLPENPGLTDARRPAALPVGEELSLSALEERLRETDAVSPQMKIYLKAELDALVARFRLAGAGRLLKVQGLRQPYDRLITKAQAALRKDPQLSQDITASREGIWESLASPTQSARVN